MFYTRNEIACLSERVCVNLQFVEVGRKTVYNPLYTKTHKDIFNISKGFLCLTISIKKKKRKNNKNGKHFTFCFIRSFFKRKIIMNTKLFRQNNAIFHKYVLTAFCGGGGGGLQKIVCF